MVVGRTGYRDLNSLLDDFVACVRAVLEENFAGAYLVGSFALGGADEHSDVDFLVVTNGAVTDEQLAELQRTHGQLYDRDTPWAQHLEGSYAPREILRRVDPPRTPFLYLDNGARELVSDEHCNTAVVRWTLRERGVALAGPDPKTLVDRVTREQLRTEMQPMLREYAAWALEPTEAGPMSRWKQPYLVLTMCRILHTAATGTVAAKRDAGEWALRELDPAWHDVIRRALDDRPDPWARVHQPADPVSIERTLAFVDYSIVKGQERA